MYVVVNKTTIKTDYGLERSDVKKALDTKSQDLGFSISIPIKFLKTMDGFYTNHIDFIATFKDGESVRYPVQYEFNFRIPTVGYEVESTKKDILENIPQKTNTTSEWENGICIDNTNGVTNQFPHVVVIPDDIDIKLSGWAVDVPNKKELKRVYIKYGESQYEVSYGLFRPDVQKAIGLSSANVGFEVSFPIQDGIDYMYFILQSKTEEEGDFIYEPIRIELKQHL